VIVAPVNGQNALFAVVCCYGGFDTVWFMCLTLVLYLPLTRVHELLLFFFLFDVYYLSLSDLLYHYNLQFLSFLL